MIGPLVPVVRAWSRAGREVGRAGLYGQTWPLRPSVADVMGRGNSEGRGLSA